MKILALNCGSSTVKFQLFESGPEMIRAKQDRVLARGAVDRIGSNEGIVSFEQTGEERRQFSNPVPDHSGAIHAALACLTDLDGGLLRSLDEIDGVGHRMVYVGEEFTGSVVIDKAVEQQIEQAAPLAPLHTPHNLSGYRAIKEALPGCGNVAVFDTAFHQTMPPRAYLYGLPYEYYLKDRIRRYGFHGISHDYVCRRFAELHNARPDDFKLITCHLGSGSSVCAIDRGRSVDTSLGFSPLPGLVMGTRPGDLDPGALLRLMETHDWSVADASAILNRRSGLYGLSGISNDMRELVERSREGDQRARLAIDVFCYRVKKYIGSYFAVLDGADAVIFTGGIGENAPLVREQCCESLETLGLRIDDGKNKQAAGAEMEISPLDATTKVWVIPTNEELLIARETVRCLHTAAH